MRGLDQIIVIDSRSNDNTVDLARSLGAEVIQFDWNGKYPKKKQWCLEHPSVRNDWVLFIDADESPTPKLLEEISNFVFSEASATVAAADIRLNYYFMGRKLAHGHRVSKRTLVNRRKCKYPEIDDLDVSAMGELEGHYQPEVVGSVVSFRERIDHLDPDPLFSYFARHNCYSDWEAYLRLHPSVRSQVRRIRSSQGRLFDAVPFKPLTFFLYSYIIRGGWRDGRTGLDYALALAFYYWQIDIKTREQR